MNALAKMVRMAKAENRARRASTRLILAASENAGCGKGRYPRPKVIARRAAVMRLIEDGVGHAEIAERLGIDRNTVKQDVWQVRHK